MRIFIIGGFIAAGLSLSTTATFAEEPQKQDQPSTTATTSDVVTEQPGAPAAGGNATTPDKDDPMVCKRVEAQTGSRVGARKVCRKASEWRTIQDGSREAVEGVQRSGTDLKAPGS